MNCLTRPRPATLLRSLAALICLLLSSGMYSPAARAADSQKAEQQADLEAVAVAGSYTPSAADFNTASLLVQARSAIARLDGRDGELEAVDREAAFNTALEALTGLYQLHGCEWALEPLLELRRRPDCTEMHVGWSVDGRVALSIQRLELSNPAYDDYTILLCTLSSNSALVLEGPLQAPLEVTLLDGSKVDAQPLDRQHPLWSHLQRLETTFVPQGPLQPRAGLSFKQIIALPKLRPAAVSRVESAWGEYRITVPFPENGDAS